MEILNKNDLRKKLRSGDSKYEYGVFDNLDEESAIESIRKILDYESTYPYSSITKEIPHITLNIPKFCCPHYFLSRPAKLGAVQSGSAQAKRRPKQKSIACAS